MLKVADLSIVQYILLGSEIRDLSATEAIICGYKIGSSRNLIHLPSPQQFHAAD